MALRRALARGLGQWGRSAAREAHAGPWKESVATGLAPAQEHTLCTHSTAAGGAAAAWQHAGGLRLPAAAAATSHAGKGTSSVAAAAAAGLRPYSSNARESMQEAAQRIKKVATASGDALKAAGGVVSRAPGALYQVLPTSAKQLVNAAQTPGAVNRVISLQLTAFWQNHSKAIVGLGAATLCYALWRTLYRTSQLFVDLSETMATMGLFSLAASAVAFGYLYLRRRYTIDPQAAYRLAMYRLNTHPGLLEVMGAPLVGSPVQASVLTGGGIKFKGLRPRLRSKRIQMIFPLKGSERRGLASLEAKKRHGQLRFVLLAVDVPSVAGGEQRIFLQGGPALYDRGGVLDVLRDPFIRALSMEDVFMAEDEAEDTQEEREREAAAASRHAAAAAKQPKPLDQGGGLYFYEAAMIRAKQAWSKLAGRQQQAPATAAGDKAVKVEPTPAARAA